MPSNDPLVAALEAAARIRDGVFPKVADRFAKSPRRARRSVSLEQFASLDDVQAEELLRREGPSLERQLQSEIVRRLGGL